MDILKGKVALVTGGSRGIGAAIAVALAEAGADVAVSYASSPDKAQAVVGRIEALGRKAVAIKADQADTKAVEALVKSAAERLGRLDILVNNAGVAEFGPVGEIDDAHFQRLFAVNVTGVFAAVRAAATVMAEDGRIITIGSVNGDRIFVPGLSTYGGTKAAVAGLTRGWARDLAPKRITVNVIQPGPIDTDMNPADGPFAAVLAPATALGRYGRPEEVAATAVFLASPGASYITGTTIDVDGGFMA